VRCFFAFFLVACSYDWSVAQQQNPCDMLAEQILTMEQSIHMCTSSCNDHVTDLCGCDVPVESAQSQASVQYTSYVQIFESMGCMAAPYCGSRCQASSAQTCYGGYCS
jgi:hypothetical protein